MEIKNILVVGGGLMGKNIAFVYTKNPNFNVTVLDIVDMDLQAAIRKNAACLGLTDAELDERLSRISFTMDMDCDAVKNADIVVEAIFEKLELKQELFARLEERCRSDAIFCTNTSAISPTEISRNLKHRERFVGTHFWNPAHLIPLVEVVKSDATSDETAELMMRLLDEAGKEVVLCRKDVPGFIGNRLQHALWREAIYIVESGIADAAMVDKAVRNSFGLRLPQLGPLENADMIGLDLTDDIHTTVFADLCDSHETSAMVKQLIAEGKLGFKTGEGLQKWSPEAIEASRTGLNDYLVSMLNRKKN